MKNLPFALAMAALIILAGVLAVRADTAHHECSRGGYLHPWAVQVASEDSGSRPGARTARTRYQRAYPRPRESYHHEHHHFAAVSHHHFVRHHRHHSRAAAVATNPVGPLVTVKTAADISITVANSLANKFKGFIADLVAEGYTPKHIGCFATGGHVTHSRHYVGAACDFDQTGWGRTAAPMYHVGRLAAKYGLRDGCSFGDCGHIDDGRVSVQIASRHWPVTLDNSR